MEYEFTREINQLLFMTLVAFLFVALSAGYWAMTGQDTILEREDNPRAVEAEVAIQRGTIYDRHNNVLAASVLIDGVVTRQYDVEAFYSGIGYFSFRYGTGGAEAAYDDILSGDNLPQHFNTYVDQTLLHRAQVGSDIRLTFDTEIQQAVFNAMGDKRGAVVVLSVPTGEVLSLVSLPTYNPNVLDAEWENLIEAEGNPFFNRVLQGQYQPGGMLQTPLMTAGILMNQPFDVVTADATAPISVDDIELACAVEPPEDDLTFAEAYAYACPRPFALLAQRMNQTTLENILTGFRLDVPPALTGFIVEEPEVEATPELTPEISEEIDMIANLLGQGDLTINPLSMATLTASVINGGNAPQPYVLSATKQPDSEWVDATPTVTTTAVMTENAARRIRDLMIRNTTTGVASAAQHEGMTIGGHAAQAVSGEATQVWYIGFVQLENNHGAVVVVVLEDSNDVTEAVSIGGIALETAHTLLRESSE